MCNLNMVHALQVLTNSKSMWYNHEFETLFSVLPYVDQPGENNYLLFVTFDDKNNNKYVLDLVYTKGTHDVY